MNEEENRLEIKDEKKIDKKNENVGDQRQIDEKNLNSNENKEIILGDQRKVNKNSKGDIQDINNEEFKINKNEENIFGDQKKLKIIENNGNILNQKDINLTPKNMENVKIKNENSIQKEEEKNNDINKEKINVESQRIIMKENIENNELKVNEEPKEQLNNENLINNIENMENQDNIITKKVERLKESVIAENYVEGENEENKENNSDKAHLERSIDDFKLLRDNNEEEDNKIHETKKEDLKEIFPDQKQIIKLEEKNLNSENQGNI